MKAKLLLPLCCLLSLGAAAQAPTVVPSSAALEEKFGFRDAVLETDTTAFHDLHPYGVPSDKRMRSYWRTNDPKKIGEAAIEDIIYTFYKGKLYRILITTANHVDSQELLKVLVAKYGAGEQDKKGRQAYLWVTKRVMLLYQESSYTGKASVGFLSQALDKQKSEEDEAATKKAAGDL